MAVNLFKWSQLINHRPSEAMQRDLYTRFEPEYLTELRTNPSGADPDTGYFHALEDANSDRMNFDLYPVAVTQLPTNPATGTAFTQPEALLTYMRLNLNTFLPSDTAEVFPYTPKRDASSTVDETKWKSSSPAGTVMTFDIKITGPDQQASVVATLVETKRWIFSPWKTPEDGNHPVSGNREFGFVRAFIRPPELPSEFEPDVKLQAGDIFYIRAVDRVTGTFVPEGASFDGAVRLWTGWQQLFKNWVVDKGGKADVVTHIQGFQPWDEVRKKFFAPKIKRLHPPQTEVFP
jgi:hypothetical protein